MGKARVAILTGAALLMASLPAAANNPDAEVKPSSSNQTATALIEIPAGSAIKYEIDPVSGRLVVDRFLSMPVAYPANYGFIPNAMAGDGDPLDVLVYTRTPLLPGVTIEIRPIGVLKMTDGGLQDDKLIAVPTDRVDPTYANIRNISDLPSAQTDALRAFFRVYKDLPEQNSAVVVGDLMDAEVALASLRSATANPTN